MADEPGSDALSETRGGRETDFLQWRERPWTICVIVGIGVVGNFTSLVLDFSVGNVILTAIYLALLAGLWHGNPGVRLFYIIVGFFVVGVNSILLVAEPAHAWPSFTYSVAIFTLLLAPPTHRWAQQREERREQKRARARLSSADGLDRTPG